MLDTDLDRLCEELKAKGTTLDQEMIKLMLREVGEIKKGQEAVLDTLETRFGGVTEPLQKKIRNITDSVQLRELLKKAILSTDLEEFEKGM